MDVHVVEVDVYVVRSFTVTENGSVEYRRQKVVSDVSPGANDAQFQIVAFCRAPLTRLLF